jgi:predicted nucleic acid-binding protein
LILYAESSAILAWLLAEDPAEDIRAALADAELVLSSDLTLIECERGLIQARARGRISESEVHRRASQFRQAAHHWVCLALEPEVADRAMAPFPNEPIRTLDALHLAFALAAQSLVGTAFVLTLDDRLRESALALGMKICPESDQSV